MLKRIAAGLLGAFNIANGLYMLFDGARWFERVPGVTHTGPFNPHFVMDVGAAFLAAGLALIARSWRPGYWPAAVAGAGFLVFHALIHVWGWTMGHTQFLVFESASVVAPAAVALWAALPSRGEMHA